MLRKILYKLAQKEDKDKNIPTKLVMETAIEYLTPLLRGMLFTLFGSINSKRLFLGRNVKIVGKDRCSFGNNVRIGNNSVISGYSELGVTLGNNSKLGDNSVIRCSTIQHLGKGVSIGANSCFDSGAFFGASGFISIGDDVIGGQNIKFHAENHIYKELNVLIRNQGTVSKGITIGNNCWIGSNVVFLDGSSIGNGCIVAACAVVNKKFPDNVVIAGIPAIIIKFRGKN